MMNDLFGGVFFGGSSLEHHSLRRKLVGLSQPLKYLGMICELVGIQAGFGAA
jgi:hypothetical protein